VGTDLLVVTLAAGSSKVVQMPRTPKPGSLIGVFQFHMFDLVLSGWHFLNASSTHFASPETWCIRQAIFEYYENRCITASHSLGVEITEIEFSFFGVSCPLPACNFGNDR
jgi:hypothetical protein